jgi:hypothetical protein
MSDGTVVELSGVIIWRLEKRPGISEVDPRKGLREEYYGVEVDELEYRPLPVQRGEMGA